jgi:hypothetical protein
MAEHGTRGGYMVHIRAGEEPCTDCKKGNAKSQREYLANNPKALEMDRLRKRATTRAQVRLKRAFPIEFLAFYQEEVAKEINAQRETESAGGYQDSPERIPLHPDDQGVATNPSHGGGEEAWPSSEDN